MDRMPPLFALFLSSLLLISGVSLAAGTIAHQEILVNIDTPQADAAFREIMHSLDMLSVKSGDHVIIAAEPGDLDKLRQAGLSYRVLKDNIEAEYASRSRGVGFGVFHTYSENIAWVDSLHLLYPEVVSEKWSIGQTHQGRDIWCFRVSDNPEIDENEPEVLIDGMHHAREIMASEFPTMFAEYLAQNYHTDPEITYLLNNRELYIVPIVNPDGVVYNEEVAPSGGGMWRKNRRNNGDGSWGVDPNRNYPYEWGLDNSGSSPDPDSDTYRGPFPASEPCVQALMEFINGRNIRTHDSVHSYSNLTLYPWGYNGQDTPHGDTFEHMAIEMCKHNGYAHGQPGDLLWYDTNGGTFDWAYGADDEHEFVYSFTNEIGSGSDGFWPDESRRGPLFQENVWPHIYLMRVAGVFIDVSSPVVTAAGRTVLPGEEGTLDLTIANQSVVASAMNLSLTIESDDPWTQFGASEITVGDLAAMTSTTLGANAIPFTVDADCPNGHLVPFTVTVHQEGDDLTFNLSFMIGTPNAIFFDDFESGLANWTPTGQWGTSSTSHSGSASLTDSPAGEYTNQANTSATLNGSYQAATLSFWHRFDIEDGYDYGRVQVSTNGTSWTTIQSYDGTQNTWEYVELDLADYAGQEVQIRFMLETDYSVTQDGWYIDDVALTGAGSDNLAPAAPLAISPVGGEFTGSMPQLTVANTVDPEGSPVTYGFRVYNDEACTELAASVDNVGEGIGQTAWTCTPLSEGTHFWRAYGSDGVERSLLSEKASFNVQTTSGVGDILIDGPRLQVLGNVTGGGAQMQLSLPTDGNVTLDIYDARGARVRQLHSGYLNGGGHTVIWDGRDSHGRNASSGLYLVRAKAAGHVLTGRVVVVR